MNKAQPSEISAQERFIIAIRDCACRLAARQEREKILNETASCFAEFSSASDALIIDISRDSLELYRSSENGEEPETTVVLEESVAPLLDLLRDRYLTELGIRVFNLRIVDPPDGIPDDFIAEALEELGVNQGFILPLTVARHYFAENVQGFLLLKNVPSHKFADPGHLALLRMATDLLSLTGDNTELGYALARLRPTDQTTGLASNHKLMSQLLEEVERAKYLNRSFALVLADIDNFKSFNLRQGYRFGDLVVKTVADDLLLESRPIDMVSRWGSEEYLVLLPEVGPAEAMDFAERCRKRVAEHPITPNDYLEEIFVSLSFGISLFPEHGNSAEHLLRNVELALLQSKLSGRNRSTVWSEEFLLADV